MVIFDHLGRLFVRQVIMLTAAAYDQ